ncbi:class I SAM-dependent methyltransferase [Nocardioides sp.]|uniref:class I SAM-dependent methyltransferase n=1 Tax=Nocardioides sp. TaxID=35761 RepID=UPI003D0AC591
MTVSEAMTDEFDTVAAWTGDAVAALGMDHALPAACRGTGSPAALDWLCENMALGPGDRLLDVGAGLGGPAEYAARTRGVRPVLFEPMVEACHAGRRLFAHPVAAATGDALALPDAAFEAVWCLGVLCTVEDHQALVAELRRVVTPGGVVGLLVFERTVDVLPEQPEGNTFPTAREVAQVCGRAGLRIIRQAAVSDFAPPGPAWNAAADAVERWIEGAHGADARWKTAARQQAIMTRLVAQGLVAGRLYVARPEI